MERRLKQIHAEKQMLRRKEANAGPLSQDECARLEELANERDEITGRVVTAATSC